MTSAPDETQRLRDGSSLREHDALLRAVRRDWPTQPDLHVAYRQHRPAMERVNPAVLRRACHATCFT